MVRRIVFTLCSPGSRFSPLESLPDVVRYLKMRDM